MILTIKNTKKKNVQIKDAMGITIPTAFYYNTKTKLVGTYLIVGAANGITKLAVARKNGQKVGKAVKIKIKIPGSFAVVNGKRVL